MEREVEAYLRRKHPAAISAVELVEKEDLDLKNHLSGLKRRLMKARAEPAKLPFPVLSRRPYQAYRTVLRSTVLTRSAMTLPEHPSHDA